MSQDLLTQNEIDFVI